MSLPATPSQPRAGLFARFVAKPARAPIPPASPSSPNAPPEKQTAVSPTASSATLTAPPPNPADLLLPTPPASPYSPTAVHLGSGTFGPVDLAVHTATKESFALKRLATGQPIADPLERRMLMNELLFGQTLAHPNIIRTFEAVQDQTDRDAADKPQAAAPLARTHSERSHDTAGTAVDPAAVDDGSKLPLAKKGSAERRPANEIRLAMEVCPGGGLLKHLLEKGTSGYGLGEDEARRMFRQLVGAVAYLHKRSIAHRDLKLDNLLLDKDMNVKLIDFGMATFFDPEKPLTEWMGSIWYEAPEIHLEHPYRPDKIDVWALGIILYTLLVSQFPFSITDPRKAVHIITTTDLKLPSHCSPAAQRLFSRMCERDPGKRADIFEVLWDGWVNEGHADLPHVGAALPSASGAQSDRETEDVVDLMMRFCGHDPTVLDADLTNKFIEARLRELLVSAFRRQPAGVVRLPLFEEGGVPVLISFRRKAPKASPSRSARAVPAPQPLQPTLPSLPLPAPSLDLALDISLDALALAPAAPKPAAAEPARAAPPPAEEPEPLVIDFDLGSAPDVSLAPLSLPPSPTKPLPSTSPAPPAPAPAPATQRASPPAPAPAPPQPQGTPVRAVASSATGTGTSLAATPSESPSVRRGLGSVFGGWGKRLGGKQ